MLMVCERRAPSSADTGPVAKDDKRKACLDGLDGLPSRPWPVEVEVSTGVQSVREFRLYLPCSIALMRSC